MPDGLLPPGVCGDTGYGQIDFDQARGYIMLESLTRL